MTLEELKKLPITEQVRLVHGLIQHWNQTAGIDLAEEHLRPQRELASAALKNADWPLAPEEMAVFRAAIAVRERVRLARAHGGDTTAMMNELDGALEMLLNIAALKHPVIEEWLSILLPDPAMLPEEAQ